MALNDYETATQRGAPIELYEFTYGIVDDVPLVYRYTDHELPVTYDSNEYTPLAILRDAFTTKGRAESGEVKVSVPLDSEVAELFRIYPPGQVVSVRIRQGHVPNLDDPGSWASGENFPVAWVGRVLEGNRKEATCDLTCESVSASMKRPGLRRHYQWPCPLVLYGSRCQADQVAATTTATVAAASGNEVTLATGWTIPNEDATLADYVGGLLTWDGATGPVRRTILRTLDTDTFKVSGPTTGLVADDEVTLVLGCPHTLAGCGRVHGNSVNYGGHPFIPTYNPLNKNNHT